MAIDNNKEANRRKLRKDIQIPSWRFDIIYGTGGGVSSLDSVPVNLDQVGEMIMFVSAADSYLQMWVLRISNAAPVADSIIQPVGEDLNLRWYRALTGSGGGTVSNAYESPVGEIYESPVGDIYIQPA